MKKIINTIMVCLFAITNLVACKKEPVFVTFYNYDGEVLYQVEYDEDMILSYGGEIPEKPSDDIYEYEFIDWNHKLSEVGQYKNFYALYNQRYKNFEVNFYNDGLKVKTITASYGSNVLDQAPINIKRKNKVDTKYYFSGWGDVDLTYITGNLDCHAEYKSVPCYLVEYIDSNDKVVYSEYIEKGHDSTSTYSISGYTEGEGDYCYIFSGWSEEVVNVKCNKKIYAEYEKVDAHSVTYKNYNGDVLYVSKVPTGYDSVYKGSTPSKPSTQSGDYIYNYSFDGWSNSTTNVQNDIIVTAQFETKTKVTGQTAIKNHLNDYGTGTYNMVSTGSGTTLGYSGSYYYVSYENSGELYSAIAINFSYGASYGIATFQIKDGYRIMYEANMYCYVSNHNFSSLELISIDTCKYYTDAEIKAVAALSILAADMAVDNASSYLKQQGLPYIY